MVTNNASGARSAVKDIVIPHDAFKQILNRLERLWRDAEAHIPIVALFIGETGTGKSTAIRTFFAKHPQNRTPEGLVIPVLSVETPTKPTPKGLAERILESLGDPRPTAGSASAKMDRIIKNLGAAQTRAIILDDMQHFVDKHQHLALFDASDYLKELIIRSDVALLCFGLPESELVIESNEQLKTRSKAVFELERFDWMEKTSQTQFVAVLNGFQKEINRKGLELPMLGSPEMSLRMYLATGGLIRYVAKVLSTALGIVIDAGANAIRLEDLSAAWSEEIVGAGKTYKDPFSRRFELVDLANKIALAKTIGQRAPRPTRTRERKASAVLAETGL